MKRFLLLLFVFLLIAIGAGAVVYSRIKTPYRGYTAAEQFVEVPTHAGTRAIGERLVAAGVVRDNVTWRVALATSGQGRHLKAGEYRFTDAMTPEAVIAKIARGDVYVISVTFPEGLTAADMAKVFEAHGLGPASDFADAARDAAAIHTLDPRARDLEGYLFPETYLVPRRTGAAEFVRLMVDRFEKVFTPEIRAAVQARGLSVHDAVTLASIVEKETGRAEERPVVAAVYENRLRIHMGLQCDPTVIYALEREGRYTGNLTRDDLMFDSPYNTYRYAGLPPGPIANPGKASLEAVGHPADVDYLYFVSRNDGTHVFSKTLEEHNRNVQKFQILPFRQKRLMDTGKVERQEGRKAEGIRGKVRRQK